MTARVYRSTILLATLVAGLVARPLMAQTELGSKIPLRDSLVTLAKAQVGTKYVFGGTTPDGFDCSGLVRYLLAALDLNTPRTARQQATIGSAVIKDPKRLLPGDLLTFTNTKGVVSHVGIYIGDGRYIHASSAAGRVVESPINRQWSALRTIWQGARRLVAFVDPSDTSSWRLKPLKGSLASNLAARRKKPAIPSIALRKEVQLPFVNTAPVRLIAFADVRNQSKKPTPLFSGSRVGSTNPR